MLYNDCIEFSVASWIQTHTIECETGLGSPHATLKGTCEGIPVICGLWIDDGRLGDSYRNESHGLFKVAGRTDSLSRLRTSTQKILIDVHMSAEIYGRLLDTLNRQVTQGSLTCSAYYRMREDMQKAEESWFDVLTFEVSESVAKS